MKRRRRPQGVEPYYLWKDNNPEPTLGDLLARYMEVASVVAFHRQVSCEPDYRWLAELGVAPELWSHG